MQRIEMGKRSGLGRFKIVEGITDTFEFVGQCKNLMVYVDQWPGHMEVEVVDPTNCNRSGLKRVMNIQLSKYKNSWHVDLVRVDSKYQGNNIAPKIYAYLIKRLNIVLKAGKLQSAGGRRIWASLSKIKGVQMYAMDRQANVYHIDDDIDLGELESQEIDIYDGRKQISVFAVAV